MATLVIEHLKASDLPAHWAESLKISPEQTVTVRIETEIQTMPSEAATFVTDDPAFGIWRDREDMVDVAGFVRNLRNPRYNRDGSRNES